MIRIDGSVGEGGGSILRYALALACVIREPVEVYNVRARRSRPGLRPQHLAVVRLLKEMADADVEGAEVGSTRVVFRPRRRPGGRFSVDIGTAGSISLLFQAALAASVGSEEDVRVEAVGGTDVPRAPPIDYMKEVFLKNLRIMGVEARIEVVRRGHYPRGGGRAVLEVRGGGRVRPIRLVERGDVREIRGRAHATSLPGHVAERMARSAEERIAKEGWRAWVEREVGEGLGPGAGITLWAKTSVSTLGGDSLGRRGKPSEVVGLEAAEALIGALRSGAPMDPHSGDMVIPYLALAPGESEIRISRLTLHAISNVKLCESLLGVSAEFEGEEGGPGRVVVRGIGI